MGLTAFFKDIPTFLASPGVWGWFWGCILLLTSFRWYWIGLALKDPDDDAFSNCRNKLRDDSFSVYYHRLLADGLDRANRWIGDGLELAAFPKENPISRYLGVFPWTPKSYALVLKLSIAYPIACLAIVYAVWGGDGRVGVLLMFDETSRWGAPVVFLGAVFARIFAFAPNMDFGMKSRLSGSAVFAAIVLIALPLLLTIWFHSATTEPLYIHEGPGLIIALAAALILFSSVSGSNMMGIVLLTIVFAIANTPEGVAKSVLFGTIFCVGVGFGALRIMSAERRSPTLRLLAYPVYSLLIVTTTGVVLSSLPPELGPAHFHTLTGLLLIFFVILPLINGFWDWISLAVTRGLLSAIRLGRHSAAETLGWSLLDLFMAVIFLMLIIVTITAGLNIANHLSASASAGPLVDLVQVFNELRLRPNNPDLYWIYFMILTTLLPTLIHMTVASAAIVLWFGKFPPLVKWRTKAATSMGSDAHHRFAARSYLTFVPMGSVIAPGALLWLMYLLVSTHHGFIGGGIDRFSGKDGALEWRVRNCALIV